LFVTFNSFGWFSQVLPFNVFIQFLTTLFIDSESKLGIFSLF
jgi:hypothetical protein